MKKIFTTFISGFVVAQYAGIHWWNEPKYVGLLISPDLERPFVYRALMPTLIRWTSATSGVRYDYVAVILAIAAGICFSFFLRDFLEIYYEHERMEIVVVVAVFLFVLIFQKYRMLYDLPNAIFFTLALAALVRRNWLLYLVVFTASSFNRETTILLLPIFLLTYVFSNRFHRGNHFKYLGLALLQILIFASIQLLIRNRFSGNGGQEAWVRPWENIQAYRQDLALTILSLLVFSYVLYLVLKRWKKKPLFLRIAFICLTPVFPLHLFLGYPFEFRAMIEIYPAIIALILPFQVKTTVEQSALVPAVDGLSL